MQACRCLLLIRICQGVFPRSSQKVNIPLSHSLSLSPHFPLLRFYAPASTTGNKRDNVGFPFPPCFRKSTSPITVLQHAAQCRAQGSLAWGCTCHNSLSSTERQHKPHSPAQMHYFKHALDSFDPSYTVHTTLFYYMLIDGNK